MAASTPPSGTAYPVVSAAQKQRSRSRSVLTGMLIGPRAKTMAVSDGPRLSHTVARTPSAPLLRMVAGQPPHQGDDRTDLHRVQTPSGRRFTRRRGWLGIAAEPETYQPSVIWATCAPAARRLKRRIMLVPWDDFTVLVAHRHHRIST
jgi:hypothetical protein